MIPRIGAVVVSHNSADDLPACLDALAAASGVGGVVVVDNASRDSSREIAAQAGVKVIGEADNSGFAGGCNRGFKELAADNEFLAFLNPDVEVTPGCIESCVQSMTQNSEIAGVAPRLMRSEGELVDSVGQVLHPLSLEVADRGYGEPVSSDLLHPCDVLAPCGALAVFRTAALEAVADEYGPWAEHYFCFWEDLELGWRLVNNGHRILALPEAVAAHCRGAGAVKGRGPLRWRRPPHLEACIITNRWMTLIRHLHPLDLGLRLPLLLVWDFALVVTGLLRRPALFGHLRRRWPLVAGEWRSRRRHPRRRLHELL
jgi:GT2 family glycosyltransferase